MTGPESSYQRLNELTDLENGDRGAARRRLIEEALAQAIAPLTIERDRLQEDIQARLTQRTEPGSSS